MIFPVNTMIAGHSVQALREALRFFNNSGVELPALSWPRADQLSRVARCLGSSLSGAERYLAELADLGYLTRDNGEYRATIEGSRARCAQIGKPLSRAKADAMLDALIERVQAVNANPELSYGITRLVVFGSYITNKTELGDLDIGYEARRKAGADTLSYEEQVERTHLETGYAIPRDYDDWFWFTETTVLRVIRNRQSRISLNRLGTVISLGTPYRDLTHLL